jgi:hypothetical protein
VGYAGDAGRSEDATGRITVDLNEIEEQADRLVVQLLAAGKQEALLLGIQIEGLKDLATIKALRDSRAEHNVAMDLQQRELAAMETVAANMPTQYPLPDRPRCGQRWSWGSHLGPYSAVNPEHYEICTLPPQHSGVHHNEVTGIRSDSDLGGGVR